MILVYSLSSYISCKINLHPQKINTLNEMPTAKICIPIKMLLKYPVVFNLTIQLVPNKSAFVFGFRHIKIFHFLHESLVTNIKITCYTRNLW